MEKFKDDKVAFFINNLKNKVSDNLKFVALFGSRARNDFREGSDYDFLIVLSQNDNEIKKIVREVEVDFLNKFDILSSALIYNEAEWEERKKVPIGVNILKEGIFYE